MLVFSIGDFLCAAKVVLQHRFTFCGEVAEWLNVPDSKSGVREQRTGGSNPPLSAKID